MQRNEAVGNQQRSSRAGLVEARTERRRRRRRDVVLACEDCEVGAQVRDRAHEDCRDVARGADLVQCWSQQRVGWLFGMLRRAVGVGGRRGRCWWLLYGGIGGVGLVGDAGV